MSTLPSRVVALLATPSRAGLAYALRHPETWPAGFVWDYRHETTCALGLAQRLWPRKIRTEAINITMLFPVARALDLDIAIAIAVFWHGPVRWRWFRLPRQKPTPEDVAWALDRAPKMAAASCDGLGAA